MVFEKPFSKNSSDAAFIIAAFMGEGFLVLAIFVLLRRFFVGLLIWTFPIITHPSGKCKRFRENNLEVSKYFFRVRLRLRIPEEIVTAFASAFEAGI